MSEKLSQCNICKEPILQTGKFSMTILRARRIPRKSSKVNWDSSISAWGMTKFQKYLAKRANSSNTCEITCGTCGTTHKIPMAKKKKQSGGRPKNTRKQTVTTPLNLSMNLTPFTPTPSKKKRKKPKEENAGLTIPTSFVPSSTPENKRNNAAPFSSTTPDSTSTGLRSSPRGKANNYSQSNLKTTSKSDSSAKQSKLIAAKNAMQQSLRSSAASGSGGSSLEKFLS